MENPQSNDLESLKSDSRLALMESIENLQLPLEIKRELDDYLLALKESDDTKADVHQQKVLGVLEELIESGEKEKAGLIFNLHRILTQFRGYGANEKASSDVKACYNSELQIPEEGLIVVDRFATRNLPAIVNWCEENGVDLNRIRVRVPRMLFAAQLNGMNDDKRQEYEEAIGKLSPDCFLIKDVNHCMDIPIDGDIGVLFSPRTLPINPKLEGVDEEETIKNYQELVRDLINKAVPGSRFFINIAVVDDFEPVNARIEAGKKRNLAKMCNQVTVKVAEAIVDEFKSAGFLLIDSENKGPLADYDHTKAINGLHVQAPV